MSAKNKSFVTGIIFISFGLLTFLPKVFGISDDWMGYSSWAFVLGIIFIAVTPFQRVDNRYVFSDTKSILSFIIVGIFLLVELISLNASL